MVVNREYCLLGCDAVWSGRGLLSFRKNLLPLSAENTQSSLAFANFYQNKKRYIPEENFSLIKTFKRSSF